MLRPGLTCLFACVILLGLSGCSGARDVRTQGATGCGTATIVPENQFNRSRAAGPFGVACEGGEVRVRICGQSLNGKSRLRVGAGPQQLQVAYVDERTPFEEKVLQTRAMTLSFTAEAGKTYAIRGSARWSGTTPTVTLWIVDGSNGRTVTSVVVPQANVIIEDQGWQMI